MKNDPFRYWLTAQEAKWDRDSPFWRVVEGDQRILREQTLLGESEE